MLQHMLNFYLIVTCDYMAEITEFGILRSFEEEEELQEKLKEGTHSKEIQTLREENKNLKKEVESHKNALRQVELLLFKREGEAHA